MLSPYNIRVNENIIITLYALLYAQSLQYKSQRDYNACH